MPRGEQHRRYQRPRLSIEFVDALSLLALHLSRWAEEMILFSTPLTALLSCLSLLPGAAPAAKKNPDLLEPCGQSGSRYGMRHTAANSVKGLPLAYKRLQETQEPLFDASVHR